MRGKSQLQAEVCRRSKAQPPHGTHPPAGSRCCRLLTPCLPASASPTGVPRKYLKSLEAPPGFEPGIRVLQTHALPLGYGAVRRTEERDRSGPARRAAEDGGGRRARRWESGGERRSRAGRVGVRAPIRKPAEERGFAHPSAGPIRSTARPFFRARASRVVRGGLAVRFGSQSGEVKESVVDLFVVNL